MFLKCFKTQANGKKRSNIRGNLKPSAGAKWGSKLGQMRVHLGIRVCLRGGKVGVPWDIVIFKNTVFGKWGKKYLDCKS